LEQIAERFPDEFMFQLTKQEKEEVEKKYDIQFKVVFDAIRQLMTPPEKPKKMIGFGREWE
jgi:hypothetical protein